MVKHNFSITEKDRMFFNENCALNQLNYVHRAGFMLLTETFADFDELASCFDRPESVSEHSFLASNLLDAIVNSYDSLFDDEFAKYSKDGMFSTMLKHERGEVDLGDIPDNGCELRVNKDELEMEAFEKSIKTYNETTKQRMILCFSDMQKKINTVYAVDKIHFVLSCFVAIRNGIKFYDVDRIYDNLTDSDKYYISITNHIGILEMLIAHTIDLIRNVPNFDLYIKLIMLGYEYIGRYMPNELIKFACRDE